MSSIDNLNVSLYTDFTLQLLSLDIKNKER